MGVDLQAVSCMKLDLRREALLIIPENDQDRAFIEDTLGLKRSGARIALTRVPDVELGYVKGDRYVLKSVVIAPAEAQEEDLKS